MGEAAEADGFIGGFDVAVGDRRTRRRDRRDVDRGRNRWFELLDDLEGQLLGVCDGTMGVNEIMTQFTSMNEDENYDKITDDDQLLLENIIRRLVRLYEHTLISW